MAWVTETRSRLGAAREILAQQERVEAVEAIMVRKYSLMCITLE